MASAEKPQLSDAAPAQVKKNNHTKTTPVKIGDRTTSDVVVRIRTPEGRDNWFYCHSKILVEKSKYFADRLSDDWPTCQILDSRYCVEVCCQELEFNSHVSLLRLLYAPELQTWHGVRNTLGILQVAIRLGCKQMAHECVNYLEAVPWEEAEEEELLRVIPRLGSYCDQILARLQPVDPTSLVDIFISTFRFATSMPSPDMRDLKSSVQEQLEYMLTEDDDAPLLNLENNIIKIEVRSCVKDLTTRFNSLIDYLLGDCDMLSNTEKILEFRLFLSDISWVCQILNKLEMMKDVVYYLSEASINIIKATEVVPSDLDILETKLKIVEFVSKALEAIGYGHVIVPMPKRLDLVKLWLPFVQKTRHLLEQGEDVCEETLSAKINNEIWQGLESAFVSIVLTLPSGNQAEILAEWLRSEHVRYPDLTEAFEVWCYRSKVAKRRVASLGNVANGMDADSEDRH